MGSGTPLLQVAGYKNNRFNPFQGFMGSGTCLTQFWSCTLKLFQSLPGIYGVWHMLVVLLMSMFLPSFNPFQGFMGSGTQVLPMLPGRLGSFNPFQGFMGSGTLGNVALLLDASLSFNPFQGFMGSGTASESVGLPHPWVFQSLPGIYGVWHEDREDR